MTVMDPERLARYQAMSTENILEVNDKDIREFVMRAAEEGYSLEARGFMKHHGFFQAPHTTELTGVDIAMVGVPMDQGVPHWGGTRHGPEAARKWSHIHGPVNQATNAIPFNMCNIIEYGDVPFTSFSAKERCEDIFRTYTKLVDQDVVPLSCGGEHTMSFPILRAVGRDQPLGLIHLDAHADTGGTPKGGDDNNDNSVFRKAVLDGVLDPERTVQIGIRGRASFIWDFSHDTGMRVVTADELHEKGVPYIMEEIRERIGSAPAYLSVDTDAIDSTEMPGTTLPEPFGITGRQAREIIRGARGLDIVGADIAELCPPHDPQGISANLAAALMFEMLCVLAEARVARTGVKNKTHWK